ncbi:MAG: Na+/H+ antiporter subunit E [Alphaproteobacteria bacterium]|jgi:multicomponent Na+:H+ antiporter subunit E
MKKNSVILFSVILLFWLALSGKFNWYMVVIAIFCSIFTVFLAIKLVIFEASENQEKLSIFTKTKFLFYCLWLGKEIIVSSIRVARLVWFGMDKISPTFATIKTSNNLNSKQVIFANSIILTPGTLAIDLEGNNLQIHSLEKASIEGLNTMDNKIFSL